MEYNQQQPQPYPQNPQQPTNGKAVASLVLGIIAAVFMFFSGTIVLGFVSIILAVIGLVLGVQARREMPQGTAGMATAGMVLSIVVLALTVIVMVGCAACVGLIVLQMDLGAVMICVAVLAIIVRQKLAQFKKDGPSYLMILYAVNMAATILYLILGIVLILWPTIVMDIICYAFGAVIAAAGLLRVLRYFFRDKYNGMMRRDLAVGLVLVSAAAFLILRPDAVVSLLPFVFGLLLLAGCAGKIQTAADLRRIQAPGWFVPLIMAAVSLALGIVLLCQPFQSAMVLTRFIGVAIIVEGAENLTSLPIFERRIQDFYDSDSNDSDPS